MEFEITDEDVEIISTCPVCLNNKFERLSQVRFSNEIEPFFSTDLCLYCQTIFRQTRPSPNWFQKTWKYRSSKFKQKEYSLHHIYNRLLEEYRYIRYSNLAVIFSKLHIGSSIIDIGTGPGTGLKAFTERSWKAVGLEPDPTRASIGKNKHNLEIYEQTIESFISNNVFSEQFDVATVIHTLEHSHDPLTFLDNIMKVIKPNGFIYIEVPNTMNFVNWKDSLYLEHLFNFTVNSLIYIAKELNLTPQYIFYPKTKPYGFYHLGFLLKINSYSKSNIKINANISIKNILELYRKGLNHTGTKGIIEVIVPEVNSLRTIFAPFEIAQITESNNLMSIYLKKKNTSTIQHLQQIKGTIRDYLSTITLLSDRNLNTKFFSKLNRNLYDKDFFQIKYKKINQQLEI